MKFKISVSDVATKEAFICNMVSLRNNAQWWPKFKIFRFNIYLLYAYETDDYVNVEKIARNLRPKIFFCLELEFVVRDFDVVMHAVVPVEVV